MSKPRFALFLTITVSFMAAAQLAHADLIPGAASLPTGTIGQSLDPNILAAIIGMTGVLIGSILTMIGTYFLRFLDVRREDKREEAFMLRERKEKEFQIKQEIYKNFLTDLGQTESFLGIKDIENFNAEWTKMEIKMNLVCSNDIRKLLNELQDQLGGIAKKRFADKDNKSELTESYIEKRGELLDAIREDIDLFQSN
jgi:hypothetical protein